MAKIYWNSIKRGRAFASIPEHMKEAIKALAMQEVQDGILSAEDYEKFIGEAYLSI